jgi:penicillin-binding protein 1A
MVMVAVGVAGAMTVKSWLKDLPDYRAKGAFDVARPTRIFSADGKLLARLYLENREVVPISQISTDLVNGVVAIEDERFYQHHGVDPYGIVRALVTNVQRGNATGQGASTITQQYIRNTILIDERTHETLERKIREAYLALELEKRHSKREILDMYLNTIYLGEGAYGAESASQVYFAKRAKDLSLPEAALIAGLPQQPSRLNPYENPDGAIERRNQVLAHMLRKHYIDQRAYDTAVATPLDLKRRSEPDDGIYAAPFFVAHVKKLLQQQFSPAVVFKGGLTVYTTVDMKMQGYAESVIKSQLGGKGPEAALVTIDPNTGDVRALYGGSDYSKNKFNLATQGHRQPGSSFKTFVLTTAIEKGMPPYYRIDSASPALIPTKPKPWIVANSEGSGRGMITLASATAASVNTVFARLAWELGAKDIAKTAKRMGIESELPEYPSIALGTRNVTPLEMASAYGTLATGGVHHDPVFITKVVDRDGKVLYTAPTRGSRVLKPEVAYAVTDVLRGVVRSGTGTRANIGRPVAGKTGTSQNYRDVWFVGYTPQLVTSVWAGYRQEQPIYVNGRHAFGGTVCAPIWAAYMRQALAGLPSKDFAKASPPPYDPSKFHIAQSKMADLTNLTLKAAAPKLVGYPFTVEYYYSPKPKDTIIGQTMKKGDLVLRVSKGPAPITVTPTDPNAPADPGTTPSATPTP